MRLLVGDVAAVIKHLGQRQGDRSSATTGAAWSHGSFAMNVPQMTSSKLIILNLPHPRGLSRELAHNPEQQKNSAYARGFQQRRRARRR